MRHSAAVLCHDERSSKTLEGILEQVGMDRTNCRTQREALELVMAGRCRTLIVDFDLPGAQETIRMAALLPAHQKPDLLAIGSRAWPGTGQAFQSGARRILYKPLEAEPLQEALMAGKKAAQKIQRKSTRYEVKTLVYLELESGTLSGVSIDIGEQGLALQATEPIPICSNVEFRCVLPGTNATLHGHADVIWASDQGRAGLFFSKLSPAGRKQLKNWLHKRSHQGRNKSAVRNLLPSADEHVSFAATEEELQTESYESI